MFIKISLSVLDVEMTHTHKHTYAQTHRQTLTLGSIATYSVKMTDYKKGKKKGGHRGRGRRRESGEMKGWSERSEWER